MRVIGIISGKGGVGKTTTSANLGAALVSHFDKKTVIIDGNFTTPNLGLHFGIYQYTITLDEVLRKGGSPDQTVIVHRSGVRIVPTSSSSYSADVTADQLRRFIKELGDYDFVIIDSAPGVEEKGVMAILEVCDEVLVVTNPDVPAVTDASRMLRTARKMGTSIRGIELNRAEKKKYKLSVEEVESICEAQVIAVIPESAHVEKSISEGEPIVLDYSHSVAAIGFKKLAATIAGEPSAKIGLLDRLIWNITYLIKGKAEKSHVVYEEMPALDAMSDATHAEMYTYKGRKYEVPTQVETPAITPAVTPEPTPVEMPAPTEEPEETAQPAEPEEVEEEIDILEESLIKIEKSLNALEKQYQRGVLSEKTYEELKETSEKKRAEIREKLGTAQT